MSDFYHIYTMLTFIHTTYLYRYKRFLSAFVLGLSTQETAPFPSTCYLLTHTFLLLHLRSHVTTAYVWWFRITPLGLIWTRFVKQGSNRCLLSSAGVVILKINPPSKGA